jgi:hypothetical protein
VPVAADCFGPARAVAGGHAETQDISPTDVCPDPRIRVKRASGRTPERGAAQANKAAAEFRKSCRGEASQRVRA